MVSEIIVPVFSSIRPRSMKFIFLLILLSRIFLQRDEMLINIYLLCFGLEWLLEWWQWSKLMEDSSALGLASAGFSKFVWSKPGIRNCMAYIISILFESCFFIIRSNLVFIGFFTRGLITSSFSSECIPI